MNRLLIILCSLFMAMRCGAQEITSAPDMYFWMDFSPLPGSPDNPSLSGDAGYYRIKTFLNPIGPSFTNRLEFGMSMSSPPLDSWIMEKQPDGSFNPVVEVTNLVEDAGSFFLRPVPLTLTTNQIHSLIAGNWYAAVDFGESSYFGKLVPDPDSVQGPTARIVVPPGYIMPPPNDYKVLSTNNHNARVVFDASTSTDPFYLPMQFTWTGWDGWLTSGTPAFTNSGVLMTNIFGLGYHIVSLQGSDSVSTGEPRYAEFEVTTVGQELDSMLASLQQASLPAPQKRALAAALSKAAIRFNHGYITQGCAELRSFKNLLRAFKISSRSPDLYSSWAQFIIDAFNANLRH